MQRRDISRALFATATVTAAGAALVARPANATTCTGAPCYAPIAAESTVAVLNPAYPPGTVDRYGTNTSPGTTDMTMALLAANTVSSNGGPGISFLSERYLVSGNTIIFAPMTFQAGSLLVAAGNSAIQLNGPITAPLTRIFVITGNAILTGTFGMVDLYPQWWGAVANGDLNGGGLPNMVPFQQCINSAEMSHNYGSPRVPSRIVVPAGIYYVEGQIVIGAGVCLRGAGKYDTLLYTAPTSSSGAPLILVSGGGGQPTNISGLGVVGQTGGALGGGIGVNLGGTFLKDLFVSGFPSGVGIALNQTSIHLSDFVCEQNAFGVQVGPTGADITISDGETFGNSNAGIYITNGAAGESGRVIISHCRSYAETQNGFLAQNSQRLTLQGCSAAMDNQGFVYNNGAFEFTGCTDVICANCSVSSALGPQRGAGFVFNTGNNPCRNITLSGCHALGMAIGLQASGVMCLSINGGNFSNNASDGIQINAGDQTCAMGFVASGNGGFGINQQNAVPGAKHLIGPCLTSYNMAYGQAISAASGGYVNSVGNTGLGNGSPGIYQSGLLANINVTGNF